MSYDWSVIAFVETINQSWILYLNHPGSEKD